MNNFFGFSIFIIKKLKRQFVVSSQKSRVILFQNRKGPVMNNLNKILQIEF